MSARRRLARLSALSFSMPDVTEAGYSPSPGFYPPAQEILEEPEEDEEASERGSCGRPREEEGERGKTWVDNTDPISGSVFFVDSASLPRPLPNGSAIPPSNSSSSLSSSTTSLSHPHTLTSSPRPHRSSSFSTSLPPTPNDAFFSPTFPHPHRPPPPHRTHTPQSLYSSSALPSPTHSEEFDGFFASDNFPRDVLTESHTHCPSPSPSEGWIPKSHSTSSVSGGMGRRVRRGWRKVLGRGGGKHRGRTLSHGLMPSDSVPDLSYVAGHHHHPPTSVPPSPPHGELCGSRGFPLEEASIVSVRLSLKTGRPHRHWNLEKLGIVPARALGKRRYRSLTNLRFAFKNHYPPGSAHFSSSSSSPSTSLVIRGILPGTPASFAPQLQPGDTILAINGHAVALDNANSIVRGHSEEDELVLITKKRTHYGPALTSTPAHHHLLTSSHYNNLVRMVSGKQPSHRHHSPPHLLLYLTLDTKEDDPADKDVVYCYPRDVRERIRDCGGCEIGEGVMGLLVQLRGVFVTLSDIMGSITFQHQSCSTVALGGQLFNFAHVQRGKEVLLLALPASLLPRPLLLTTTLQIEHTIRLLYGSPQRGFSMEDCSSVDHLMSLLFHQLAPHPSHHHQSHKPHLLSVSPLTALVAVHREPLPVKTALRVSEGLGELESVDPSHFLLTNIAHSPRTFLPRGSVLFRKGRLVGSHLSSCDLGEIVRFCQAYRLLEISAQEPRSSIVVWREVHFDEENNKSSDDAEISGRVFLMLVGLDHMLVGLLLEGCGLSPEATPTLDPAYVNEAKQLIAKLDLLDLFDTSDTTRGSVRPQVPPIESLDRVLTLHLSTPHRTPAAPQTPQSRRSSLDKHTHSKRGSDSEEEDGGLGPRSMTLPSLRDKRKKRSEYELPSLPATTALRQDYTLTAGVDNILLHYLSLEAGQGVWLGPTHHTSSTYGTLHSEMIQCFHATCSAIRDILLAKTDEELDEDDDWISDEEEAEIELENSLSPAPPPSFSCPTLVGGRCLEHGVLVEVSLKHFATEKQLRSLPPLCYWVIGRRFPETGQELYVCYEENISQTMVEMAFKLLFASSSSC